MGIACSISNKKRRTRAPGRKRLAPLTELEMALRVNIPDLLNLHEHLQASMTRSTSPALRSSPSAMSLCSSPALRSSPSPTSRPPSPAQRISPSHLCRNKRKLRACDLSMKHPRLQRSGTGRRCVHFSNSPTIFTYERPEDHEVHVGNNVCEQIPHVSSIQ